MEDLQSSAGAAHREHGATHEAGSPRHGPGATGRASTTLGRDMRRLARPRNQANNGDNQDYEGLLPRHRPQYDVILAVSAIRRAASV